MTTWAMHWCAPWGLCPPGTYVRLDNKEVAVVMRRSPKPNLPHVAVVINEAGMLLNPPRLHRTINGSPDIKASLPLGRARAPQPPPDFATRRLRRQKPVITLFLIAYKAMNMRARGWFLIYLCRIIRGACASAHFVASKHLKSDTHQIFKRRIVI